jgi:hypothetical protein
MRLTEARLTGKIEQAIRYWQCLEQNAPRGWREEASHLDLGAGWFPSIPVTFYALGTAQQYLVDVTPHMTAEAVVNAVESFRTAACQIKTKFARMPEAPERGLSLARTLEPFGMVYAAPYEELAREIKGSVGFVTATSMLFHMTRGVLKSVFDSVHGLLKPGGFFLGQHYLRQPIDDFTMRKAPFFALRYPDWFWENITRSPMMYYNRLKARDYRELLEAAGFEIVCMEIDDAPPEERALLDRARIHPMFDRYSRDELAAKYLFFAARKAC